MPPRRIVIIGDSFIRRLAMSDDARRILERNRSIARFQYVAHTPEGSSLQSIARLGVKGVYTLPRTRLAIFHIGGNDLSASMIDPHELAIRFVEMVADLITAKRIDRAVILPILHRREENLSSSRSVYSTPETRARIEDIEDHFNTRVDIFNDSVRRELRARARLGNRSITYSKLPGLNHPSAVCDGVHLHEWALLKYARAVLQAAIVRMPRD